MRPLTSSRRGAPGLARPVLRAFAMPVLVLAAAATLFACFDESTYKGGGRRDVGGTLAAPDAGDGDEEDAGDGEPPDGGGASEPDASLSRDAASAG